MTALETAELSVHGYTGASEALPAALSRELSVMRRNPLAFTVIRRIACSLGCGKGTAYSLTHPDCAEAGSWCPVHGWLSFPSNQLRPIGEEYVPSKKRRVKVL